MKQQTICTTLVCIILLLCPPVRARDQASLAPETVKSIEAIIESEQAKLKIPGLSIAVAVGNQLRYARGFGMADLENSVPAKATTRYRTASIAKAMTATAVMQLVEQGKIDLDAPAQKYCAAFPDKGAALTIRHLLAHQSGIRHYKHRNEAAGTEHYTSITESLKVFKDDALLFEPGAKYSYTTYGYVVLGCVIEGASGLGYDDYMQKHVFQPTGMEHTRTDNHFLVIPERARGYMKLEISTLSLVPDDVKKQVKGTNILNANLHDTSGKIPGGGFLSSALDLVRFGVAVNTGKLVRPATLEQMWTERRAKDGKETGYGYGWNVFKFGEQRVILHGGNQAGARSELRILPDKGIVIAVLTNLSDAPLQEMMKGITDALVAADSK